MLRLAYSHRADLASPRPTDRRLVPPDAGKTSGPPMSRRNARTPYARGGRRAGKEDAFARLGRLLACLAGEDIGHAAALADRALEPIRISPRRTMSGW